MTRIWRATAAISIVLFLTGCGLGLTQLDSTRIENGIKDWFIESGVEIESVECPDSMAGKTGDTWWCEAWDPWGFKVDVIVEMTSSDGFVEWQVLP